MSQPSSQKRDKADFFKAYARTIPAKRTSSTTESENHSHHVDLPKKPKQAPQTPTPTRLTNMASSPIKSSFGQVLSPGLPIRSPKSTKKSSQATIPNLFSSPLRTQMSPIRASTLSLTSGIYMPAQSVGAQEDTRSVIPDSDDSESLESLEDIFGRGKDKPSPITPPEYVSRKDSTRVKGLGVLSNQERQAIVGRDKLKTILAKGKSQKFDITKLIDDHLDDAETKEKLDKANAFYEASAQQANIKRKQKQNSQDLLRTIIDPKSGDQTEVARIFGAIERTGALVTEQCFSFFNSDVTIGLTKHIPPRKKFPYRELPQDLWRFRETKSREDAYLFDEMEDLTDDNVMSDAILDWTFDAIAAENNEELREAYIRCLQRASKRWTRTNLRAQNVQNIFEKLGADSDVIRDGASMVPNRTNISTRGDHDFTFLLSVLKVFKVLANDLDFETLSKLASILIRLSLDDEVMSRRKVSVTVEELIATLLSLPTYESRLHVAERILMDVRENLKSRVFQARLLRHLPPTSSTAIWLRRSLAQIFLFGDSAESVCLSEYASISLSALLKYLKSPTFDLGHRAEDNPVDYAELAAITFFVDIAMPTGGPSLIFATPAEEKAFNLQVDQLADRVNEIFSSIADTGASHLRRTEAKEALGVLQKCLLYKVRTKPRPKKSVFGGRDGDEYRSEQRSKDAMRGYLLKKELSSAAQPVAETSGDVFPGSQISETEVLIRRQLELS